MTSRPIELEHAGTRAFIRRRALRKDFGVTPALKWQNVKIVDAAGGGDFTTVQGAIDGITDHTTSNRYLVLINGGDYTEATITLKSFVYVGGRGRDVTRIVVTNSSGGGIVDADDSGIFNLSVIGSSSGTDWTFDVDTTRSNWIMHNVHLSGRMRLGAGEYLDCSFDGRIEFNGASNQSLPVLNGGFINLNAQSTHVLTGPTGDFGEMNGVTVIAKSSSSANATISLGDDINCTGCVFINDMGSQTTRDWRFTSSGRFTGCTFGQYDTTGTSLIESTEGHFTGCTFHDVGITASATGKPLNYSGCHFHDAKITITNSASVGHFPVVISGCLLEASSGGSGSNNAPGTILDTSSSGGKRIVELNGNTYRGHIVDNFASTLRLRGTDVKATFFPVDTALGTGVALAVGQHTTMDLNAATETCFIPVRMNPPAYDLRIVDALLVVSGEFDKKSDAFVEGAGDVALAAHTPTAGTGWTLVSGTASVIDASDDVEGSAGGIHTFDDTATDGFVQVKFQNPGSNATFNHGLIFRYADTDNYWRVELDRSGSPFEVEMRLIKRVAASETTIAITEIGGGGTASPTIGVSFLGNTIKVFCDQGLVEHNFVFEDTSGDLSTNSTVGLLFGGTGAGIGMDDFEFWRGDSTLDFSVDTSAGEEGAPIERVTDSLAITNEPIAHQTFSYVDIEGALTNVRQGSVIGLKVTLDALGTVNTAFRVHGVLLRTLPTSIPVRPTQSTGATLDAQQITYR